MMRRFWFVPLGLFLILSGFLSLSNHANANDKVKVATTFTIIADITRNIAGDAAEVVSITKPGAEIHNYQPTPGDIRKTLDADLIIWNGLNLELWFQRFLANLRDVPAVVATVGIDPIDISQGPYSGRPNPHAWMSPEDVKIYITNIRDALIELDPENENTYTANAEAYMAEIDAAVEPLRQALADIPDEKRWLVSSEGAFSYLARDFDLKELFIWPINADQQGSPAQMRDVIETVRANAIPVVFSESTISPEPALQITRETDAIYGGTLYVDSLSEADGPVPTYLDLLRVTVGTIAEGFAKAEAERQ